MKQGQSLYGSKAQDQELVGRFAHEMAEHLGLMRSAQGGGAENTPLLVDLQYLIEDQMHAALQDIREGHFQAAQHWLVHAANSCMLMHARVASIEKSTQALRPAPVALQRRG